MKLVAAALAGALVAGTGVYLWRDAELDSRQSRLIDAAVRQTSAELEAERLQEQVAELRKAVARLRSDMDPANRDQVVAPPLSTEPDGRYFGYIRSIALDELPATLTIDFAEFLTGDQAQRAAEEAEEVPEGDPVPNDYFISNSNPKIRRLAIDPAVKVRWLEPLPDLKRTSLEDLEFAFVSGGHTAKMHRLSPWWITIEDGQIAEIEEQYLP